MRALHVLVVVCLTVAGLPLSGCGDGRTSRVEAAFRAASWGDQGDTVEILEIKNERTDVDGPSKVPGKRYDVKAKGGKSLKRVSERNFVVFVADQGEYSSVKRAP